VQPSYAGTRGADPDRFVTCFFQACFPEALPKLNTEVQGSSAAKRCEMRVLRALWYGRGRHQYCIRTEVVENSHFQSVVEMLAERNPIAGQLSQ